MVRFTLDPAARIETLQNSRELTTRLKVSYTSHHAKAMGRSKTGEDEMQQSIEPKSKPQRINKTRENKQNKPDHNRRQGRENKRAF